MLDHHKYFELRLQGLSEMEIYNELYGENETVNDHEDQQRADTVADGAARMESDTDPNMAGEYA